MSSPTRLPLTSMGLDADWISRVWSLGGNVQSPAGGLFIFDNEDGTYDIVRRRISGDDLDDETVETGLTEEQAARRYYEGGLPRANGRGHRKLLRSLRTNGRDNGHPPAGLASSLALLGRPTHTTEALSSGSKRENARHNAPPPNPFRNSDRERQIISLHMLAVQINELQIRNHQDYNSEVADMLEQLEALHNQTAQKLGLEETQHEMHYQTYDENYDAYAWLRWGAAVLNVDLVARDNGVGRGPPPSRR